MRSVQYLTLDINKRTQQTITANVGEVGSRFVKIQIVDNDKPINLIGVNVYLYALKSDNTKLFNMVEVEDDVNGIVLAELTSQLLVYPGTVKLTLVLTEGNNKLASKEFTLNVENSIFNDEAIESTNEFTVWTSSLMKVKEWNDYFEETSGQIEQKYTSRLNKVDEQFNTKVNKNDVGVLNINVFDESTRKAILENNSIDINYVLGEENIQRDNLDTNINSVLCDVTGESAYAKITRSDIHLVEGVIADYSYNNNDGFKLISRTQGDYVIPYFGYECEKIELTCLNVSYVIIAKKDNQYLAVYTSGSKKLIMELVINDGGNNVGGARFLEETITCPGFDNGNKVIVTNNNNIVNIDIELPSGEIQNLYKNIDLNTITTTEYSFCGGAFKHTNDLNYWFKNVKVYNNSKKSLRKEIEVLQNEIKSIIQTPSNSNWSYYNGKKGYFLGDSITQGSNGGTSYVPIVTNFLGLNEGTNKGTGGITVGGLIGESNNKIESDFITFFAGTNDFGTNVQIGTIADTSNSVSFYGTFNSLLKRFAMYSPTVPLGVITPIPRFDKEVNSNDNKLIEYVNVIVEVCKLYNIPCLNLYYECGFNSTNYENYYLADKVHLNPVGAEKIAHKIAMFINTKVF